MDDSDRLGFLLGVLDFENMPKVVKKKALMEACRILGLKFSLEELEAIETRFSVLEKEAQETVRCPFCKKRIPLLMKLAFSEHLTECPTLMRMLERHPIRPMAKRVSEGKKKKGRRRGKS